VAGKSDIWVDLQSQYYHASKPSYIRSFGHPLLSPEPFALCGGSRFTAGHDLLDREIVDLQCKQHIMDVEVPCMYATSSAGKLGGADVD